MFTSSDLRKKIDEERNRQGFKRRAWQFLEDPSSSRGAQIYHKCCTVAILCCVFASWRFTRKTSNVDLRPGLLMNILDTFFFVEPFLRFAVCPNRPNFLWHLSNWIDLVAAMQILARWYLRFSMARADFLVGLRVFVPTFMLLKLLRHFSHFHLLLSAFSNALEALPVLLFTLLLIALFFFSLLYLVEPEENIKTLPGAMWLATITISTVGYGDVTPQTSTGKVIIGLLAVIGALYTAMPLGMVGSAFGLVWDDRELIVLVSKLRNKVVRSGCTPSDLCALFIACDVDRDGLVTKGELKVLFEALQIPLSEEMLDKVFNTFDLDGEGTIVFEEMLLTIFPEHHYFQRRSPAWMPQERGDGADAPGARAAHGEARPAPRSQQVEIEMGERHRRAADAHGAIEDI